MLDKHSNDPRHRAAVVPAYMLLWDEEADLEYFDAGVAAGALQLDGIVVSNDRAFDRIEGLKRIW